MTLQVQPYPFELDGLSSALQDALPALDEVKQSSHFLGRTAELSIVGPFPSYAIDPKTLLAKQLSNAVQTGWRAVAMRDDFAMVLIEIASLESGIPSYAFRGQKAAFAFAEVLSSCEEFVGGSQAYEVRWLSIPDIYVTTLWLSGDNPLFIPTRLGGAKRVAPNVLELSALTKRVGLLMNMAQQRDSEGDRRFDDSGSPRSGLPR